MKSLEAMLRYYVKSAEKAGAKEVALIRKQMQEDEEAGLLTADMAAGRTRTTYVDDFSVSYSLKK